MAEKAGLQRWLATTTALGRTVPLPPEHPSRLVWIGLIVPDGGRWVALRPEMPRGV